MSTTLRHLAILEAIPGAAPGRSPREILDKLLREGPEYEVSLRTIQRDLAQLSSVFPIVSDPHGAANLWYWSRPHALIQIPAMSQSTAFVLRLAQDYLRQIMAPDTLRELEPYFRRAEEILADTELGRWTDRAAIIAQGPTLTPPDVPADVQEAIYGALMKRRKIEVSYRRKRDTELKRILLNPLGIVVRARIVYLVATAWHFTDPRHYVLHRMSGPQLSDEPAETPPGFRLADHLRDDGSFAYPESGDKLALRALFNAAAGAHLMESRLAPDHQATPQEDGRVLVEATVADTGQLRWWLAGFGSLVEVLEPAWLRGEFREEARRLSKIYGFDHGASKSMR